MHLKRLVSTFSQQRDVAYQKEEQGIFLAISKWGTHEGISASCKQIYNLLLAKSLVVQAVVYFVCIYTMRRHSSCVKSL